MTIYKGWEIHAYGQKPTPDSIPNLKHKIGGWFGQGEWWSSQDNDRIFIYNQEFYSPIEVIFLKEEKSMGSYKYGILIKSNFLGWGSRSEYLHKQLCNKVSHKIPWEKKAYHRIDDKLIPLYKSRILKRKKRRYR